jgi:hypothetical protein
MIVQKNGKPVLHYFAYCNSASLHNIMLNSVHPVLATGFTKFNIGNGVRGIEETLPTPHHIPHLDPSYTTPPPSNQHATHPMDDYVVGPKRQGRIREILTLVGTRAVQHNVETTSVPPGL